MLKEFRFSNFGSFRDEAVLSMEAVGLKEMKSVPRKDGSDTLLPLAAIYGKNGGGKTNVLGAFGSAVSFILYAQQMQHEDAEIPVRPFLLDDTSTQKPSSFDFEFTMDGVRYWYGFSATKENITREYLYHAPRKQKALVFYRDCQTYKFCANSAKRKRELIRELVAKNQLFLSIASNTNDDDCGRAMRWFREYIFWGNGYEGEDSEDLIIENADNKRMLAEIAHYAQSADIGIEDIEIQQENQQVVKDNNNTNNTAGHLSNNTPEEFKTAWAQLIYTVSDNEIFSRRISVSSLHRGMSADGNLKLYRMPFEYESMGTHNLIVLVPDIIRTLDCGGVLLMDELENGMHPMLVKMLLSKFQNPDTNPKNAQIIFTTHSTELLNMSLFRKDQIYLADKNRKTGVSTLYSVSDFSTPTRENVHRAYLAGKYGAFPDIEIEEVEP